MVDALHNHMLPTDLLQRLLQESVDFVGNHCLLTATGSFLRCFLIVSWFFLGLRDVRGKQDQSLTPVTLMLADMRLFYHLKNDRYIKILNQE